MTLLNYTKDEIFTKILEAEENRSYVLFENFIKEDSMPKWSDFMNAMYATAAEKTDRVLAEQINKQLEYLVGNLIIKDGIYFNFKSTYEKNKKLFPSIIEMTLEMIANIPISFYGPKISVGPYFVVPHQDRWHAATLQCEGEAVWSLKDEKYISGHPEKFELNDPNVHRITLKRGDFLYFSQKLFHQIEVDGPRASMLFNANGIKDILN